MKIGIVAPSPIPFTAGGAEKMWWGLMNEINKSTPHQADLVKLPTREGSFWELVESYAAFSRLDLSGFDLVISGKYPAWMASHPRHVCYMQHRLRGLYDCFHFTKLPLRSSPSSNKSLRSLQRTLRARAPTREALPDLLSALSDLRSRSDIPAEVFQFPGSLSRELIHYLDAIALGPREIERYYAISKTVAKRSGYFPSGALVEVLYPPSNLGQFRCGKFDYLFTASRLDGPKRIALLIEAMRSVRSSIELRIAGEGPDAPRLKELAQGDPRIIFLGYRSDSELQDDYANALAVAFVPYDEDYGLITIEAMMSGKPVLTVTDAGGPTEFVTHKTTGMCVAPDPTAIAEAVDWLAHHPDEAAIMGGNASRRVASINWGHAASELLQPALRPNARSSRSSRPSRITVASTFGIVPVRGGGQARIFNLYKNLAPSVQTEIISLGAESETATSQTIAPGLQETRIPKSQAYATAESEVSREVDWFPITDVVFSDLAPLIPDYLKALERSCRDADVVVASHPYTLPAIRMVSDKPIWYEAHNVEFLLKQNVIPKTARGLSLIDAVAALEQRCCDTATLVMACSEAEMSDLVKLYNLARNKVRIVPNGVDTRRIHFTSRAQSSRIKQTLDPRGAFTAIFIGSWHEPNLQAVRTIVTLAEECPSVRFLILGSSCLAFEKQTRVENIGFLGVLDEDAKDLILQAADIALNPMQQGSGTNLKMLEYAAAGIPIITTATGMRGLDFRDGTHVFVEEVGRFVNRIESIRNTSASALEEMTESARQHVRKYFDWRRISRNLLASL
jgi:glycosyltransferase involved in cell wall biosynthesis